MTAAGDEISSVTGSFFHSDLVLGNYLLLESQRTIGTVIYIKEAPGISSRGNKSDLTSEDFSSILRDMSSVARLSENQCISNSKTPIPINNAIPKRNTPMQIPYNQFSSIPRPPSTHQTLPRNTTNTLLITPPLNHQVRHIKIPSREPLHQIFHHHRLIA